jgi:DNA-damage-inducible protein D
MENSSNLTPFGEKIRKVWHNDEWYFSVVDIIEILTDSPKPKTYWAMMKKRETQPFTNCEPLKLVASDGRQRLTDCANTEGVFRILMSVPSPKAEPFKLWLAATGKQVLDETENPELLTERQAELYRAKGYSEEWIGRRVQTIETRKALTDEWQQRGVKENQEYAILTATIAKGTFGMTPNEHKEVKGLAHQNRITIIENDAQGFNENHDAATEGGRLAGNARRNFETDRGKPVISPQNYLDLKSGGDTQALPNEANE